MAIQTGCVFVKFRQSKYIFISIKNRRRRRKKRTNNTMRSGRCNKDRRESNRRFVETSISQSWSSEVPLWPELVVVVSFRHIAVAKTWTVRFWSSKVPVPSWSKANASETEVGSTCHGKRAVETTNSRIHPSTFGRKLRELISKPKPTSSWRRLLLQTKPLFCLWFWASPRSRVPVVAWFLYSFNRFTNHDISFVLFQKGFLSHVL